MGKSKSEVARILSDEADGSEGPSAVTMRLLSDSELDWVSGAAVHVQADGSNHAMGSGDMSYTQNGGSFDQMGAGSFFQDSGWASSKDVSGEG